MARTDSKTHTAAPAPFVCSTLPAAHPHTDRCVTGHRRAVRLSADTGRRTIAQGALCSWPHRRTICLCPETLTSGHLRGLGISSHHENEIISSITILVFLVPRTDRQTGPNLLEALQSINSHLLATSGQSLLPLPRRSPAQSKSCFYENALIIVGSCFHWRTTH